MAKKKGTRPAKKAARKGKPPPNKGVHHITLTQKLTSEAEAALSHENTGLRGLVAELFYENQRLRIDAAIRAAKDTASAPAVWTKQP